MKLRNLVALAVLAMLVATPVFGQSQAINGTIEGTVKDAGGGVLPGVTVTITNTDTGAQRVVVTNQSGLFRAPLLSLGAYKVQFEISGFSKLERSGLTLTAGQSLVLNVGLTVGGMAEEVVVTADSAPVDLAKTDVGRNLSEVEIKNLPNVARNPYNFALLEPGVTGFENEEFGVPRFAINGQMLRVNFQIDGNTNTQKDRAGLRLMPISEVMIQEVQIVSAGYAPEFGQTTGMVYNAVTPSGTNTMKGDVGYRFRTKAFSACPFSTNNTCQNDPSTKPDNSLKIATATFGGPIVKNRLFFYSGVEYTRQDLPRLVTIDPAVAAAVGLASQPVSVASYRATPFFIGKVDYQIQPAHRLSLRTNTFTNDNPYQSGGGNTAIERGNDFKDAMISSSAQLISTLGSNNLNELRFQVARRHTTRPPSHGDTTGPSVTISATTGQNNGVSFGPYTGIGNEFIQRNIQLLDNYTVLRGRHSYKAGFDVQWIHDFRGTALPVSYTFPSVQAYLDAKSGANPRGYTTFSQTIGTPNFEMDNALASWFIQDDFKLTPAVKVLYGIRHDMYLYPKGIPGAPYNETFHRDYNNIAPRVGFAWTINPGSVLRASTSINYDQPLLAIIETAYTNSGLAARTTGFNLGPTSPYAPAFPNDLSSIPPNVVQVSSTVQGMASDFVTAKTWQNNVTYERQLGQSYSVSISLRQSRGYNLPVITDVNLAGVTPVRVLADGRGVYSASVNASTRNDPRYNRVRLVESIGDSWYKGVTIALNRRWSRGVQFALNYSWGKGIDTAPLGGNVLAIQGDSARADPVNLLLDKGPNQLDIRHTFNASIVAISSVTRLGNLMNKILSDNQIALILLVNSGQPDGIAGSRDLNLDGNNGDRPLFITRNSMHAPVRKNVDMRYSRFFQLPGKRRFEVQAEAKNIFNTREVTAVSNTITVDADGYPVDPTTLARLPLDSISLKTSDYAANGFREQRKFQLGFKFYF
jgi:Carboxypeptidase regulatory-like domain